MSTRGRGGARRGRGGESTAPRTPTSGWIRPAWPRPCPRWPTPWPRPIPSTPRGTGRGPPSTPKELEGPRRRGRAAARGDPARGSRARHLARRARLLRRPLRARGRRHPVPRLGPRGRAERAVDPGGRGGDRHPAVPAVFAEETTIRRCSSRSPTARASRSSTSCGSSRRATPAATSRCCGRRRADRVRAAPGGARANEAGLSTPAWWAMSPRT